MRPPRVIARRAFTLVEAIATIVILSATGLVTTGIIMVAIRGYIDASTGAQLQADLSVALDRCVRELRNIQLDDAAATVAPDIDDLTTTSIRWDDDSSISLSGTDLQIRMSGGTPAVLLGDVAGVTIRAYDESNNQLAGSLTGAGCDQIRRLTIDLTAARSGLTESLRTKLFIRSTMIGAEP